MGFGRIGRRVAHLARAFDVEQLYYDIVRAPKSVEAEVGATYVTFDNLLMRADVISVHTPLTAETANLFNASAFGRMKPHAIFINTSRGGTFDMDALHEALQAGQIAGAGLDVFNPEPPPSDHPLLQLPNVICSPHVATGTVEAHLMKAQAQFENFRRVLSGRPPHHQVKLPA